MRLIDADTLKEKTLAHGEKIAYVASFLWDIDDSPTITAIPVEWLRTFDLYYNELSGGTPFMNELVEAWKREQDGHDVRTQAAHD